MNQIQNKRTGIWMPEGSNSQSAISEAYKLKDYGGLPSVVNFKDKVVMDAGCHIGCFSLRALEDGAKEVVGYEPFPACVESIKLNIDDPRFTLVPEALTTTENAGTPLEFHFRGNRLEASSLTKKPAAVYGRYGYECIEVPTIDFWEEVDRVKPDILKLDIEGTEWDLFTERKLPDHVKAFFVEIHYIGVHGGVDAVREWANEVFPGAKELSYHDCRVFQRPNPICIQLVLAR